MAESIGKLESIRNKFRKEDIVLKNPCPRCGHELTIEKTEFFESHICEHCKDYAQLNSIELCCSSPAYHKVKFITSNQAIQVREQCQSCGYLKPNSIGGLSQNEKDKLPLCNERLRESRQEKQSVERKTYYEKLSVLRQIDLNTKKQEWMERYTTYLYSEEWKIKRDAVLKRDQYLCQCCLNAYATQVHHKSYEFVDLKGNEPAFDLVAICVPCHEKIEEMKRFNREQNKIQNG